MLFGKAWSELMSQDDRFQAILSDCNRIHVMGLLIAGRSRSYAITSVACFPTNQRWRRSLAGRFTSRGNTKGAVYKSLSEYSNYFHWKTYYLTYWTILISNGRWFLVYVKAYQSQCEEFRTANRFCSACHVIPTRNRKTCFQKRVHDRFS